MDWRRDPKPPRVGHFCLGWVTLQDFGERRSAHVAIANVLFYKVRSKSDTNHNTWLKRAFRGCGARRT